jgi:purine catabolism regulator
MHAPPLTAEFLEACNTLPLPLINIPYPLPFIAIARSVAESSLLEESRRLRQTARVYDLLRTAGASEDHWQSLVQRLATELDAELFVVDRRCLHPWHPEGRPLPDFLAEVGPASRPGVRRGQELPVASDSGPACADHGHSHPRECAPGGVAEQRTAPGRRRAPSCRNRAGAAAFAHRACRWKAVTGWPVSSCCRPSTAAWARRTWRAAGAFDVPAQNFLVASISADASTADDGGGLADVHIELWRHGVASASLKRNNRLHVVVPADVDLTTCWCTVPAQLPRIGISAPAAVANMQRALQESLWALGSARANKLGVAHYAQGPSWLGMTGFEEGAALVRRLLGPIFDYEQSQDGDLIVTLRTYLDSQRSWQKTAAALFAHRQTIIYRIRKIGELTGLDMGETSTVAQLWFALQIHEAMEP